MPRQKCSVCLSDHVNATNLALRRGQSPLRMLAAQYHVSTSALIRHRKHSEPSERHITTAQNDDIDRNIARLIRAQRKAQRTRTRSTFFAISRELRNWYALKARLEIRAVVSKPEEGPEMDRGEAIQLAKALIEGELTSDSPDLISWLKGPTSVLPQGPEDRP
jgi:hypothetical protein